MKQTVILTRAAQTASISLPFHADTVAILNESPVPVWLRLGGQDPPSSAQSADIIIGPGTFQSVGVTGPLFGARLALPSGVEFPQPLSLGQVRLVFTRSEPATVLTPTQLLATYSNSFNLGPGTSFERVYPTTGNGSFAISIVPNTSPGLDGGYVEMIGEIAPTPTSVFPVWRRVVTLLPPQWKRRILWHIVQPTPFDQLRVRVGALGVNNFQVALRLALLPTYIDIPFDDPIQKTVMAAVNVPAGTQQTLWTLTLSDYQVIQTKLFSGYFTTATGAIIVVDFTLNGVPFFRYGNDGRPLASFVEQLELPFTAGDVIAAVATNQSAATQLMSAVMLYQDLTNQIVTP